MLVSTNQPYFAPYPGFFYKAWLSDCFVLLDEVQFPRKTTWITRNRFKNDQGTLWMTIPVRKKGLGLQKISAVRINYDGNWGKKSSAVFDMLFTCGAKARNIMRLSRNCRPPSPAACRNQPGCVNL